MQTDTCNDTNARERLFISPGQLRFDSIKLATHVVTDRFMPTDVLVLLRGAATIGNFMHEVLSRAYGFKLGYNCAITKRTRVGDGYAVDVQANLPKFSEETRLLIIDDIFDTGSTVAEVIRRLVAHGLGASQIRTAFIDYKPGKNLTNLVPDYYVNERADDCWIVYPHEISDVHDDEFTKMFGSDVDVISNLLLMCRDVVDDTTLDAQ